MSSFESAPEGFGRPRSPGEQFTEEELEELASIGVSKEPEPAGGAFLDLLAPGLAELDDDARMQLADLLDPLRSDDDANDDDDADDTP